MFDQVITHCYGCRKDFRTSPKDEGTKQDCAFCGEEMIWAEDWIEFSVIRLEPLAWISEQKMKRISELRG